jgi:NAD(P)H dehydrogenase (quinone)
MSDPPRKIVKRYVRWFTAGQARADYYALYHLNVATDVQRAAFLDRVEGAMRSL